MKIKYLQILIVAICILFVLQSCSGPAEMGEGVKNPSVSSTDTPKRGVSIKDEDFNPEWNAEVDFYFITLSRIVQAAANYYIQSHEPSDFITADYNTLVEDGLLAIIPHNIYSNEDVKQSRAYSAGDLYYYWDILDGGEFTIHFGEGASKYNPEFHEKGEVREVRERHTNSLSESWDGFSETIFAPGRDDSEGNIDPKQKGGYIWRNPEVLKMYQMQLYLSGFFNHRSEFYELPADNLDGMISTFGRKNPKCWVNPYSGKTMRELPL